MRFACSVVFYRVQLKIPGSTECLRTSVQFQLQLLVPGMGSFYLAITDWYRHRIYRITYAHLHQKVNMSSNVQF